MFRCHFCNQVTPPKTKKVNVVIETRDKQYPTRRRESKGPRGRFRSREDAIQDSGGKGTETALEVAACPTCAAKQHEVMNTSLPVETPVTESLVVAETPVAVETPVVAEAPAVAETPVVAESTE